MLFGAYPQAYYQNRNLMINEDIFQYVFVKLIMALLQQMKIRNKYLKLIY